MRNVMEVGLLALTAAALLVTFGGARPASADTAAAVTAGGEHTCALTTASGLKCWGHNDHGQLGDGTTTSRSTPVDVTGLTSGVAAVAAGGDHTCALTAAGGLKCWGDNGDGQLGDGTTTSRSTPVDVTGLTSGVAAVAAGGGHHTCAVTTAGGVKCWGDNFDGQLGDGTTTDRHTPVDVTGLTSGVAAVAAGGLHTCAVTTAGGVKCWGDNFWGQLGGGAPERCSGEPYNEPCSRTPVDVTGLTSGVAAVATKATHTCALTTTGGLKCWGSNLYGELGNGTWGGGTIPVDVTGLTSGVAAVAAGYNHTCALTTAGGLKCWGNNYYGQLGDGTAIWWNTPVDVTGLTSGAAAVAAGGFHTCALTTAGDLKCWGRKDYGQLGDGITTIWRNTPVDVTGLTSGQAAVAAGHDRTCAVTSADGLKCWGYNDWGQLGDGTRIDRYTPIDVTGLTSGVAAVTAGYDHTCALTTVGGLKCWGNNFGGQLGDGTSWNYRTTPVDVTGLTSGVAAVTAGAGHTCALTTAGGLKCWGANSYGQLGDGTTTSRSTAVDVTGLTSGVAAVAAAGGHTCALTTAGGLKCWGDNDYGQLGDGTTSNRSAPVDVTGPTSGVAAVTAGYDYTCALTTAGGLMCWGDNGYGQLGDGTTSNWSAPVDVTGLTSGVAAVAPGYNHTCAVTNAGGLKCWGYNSYGQLGDGTTGGHRSNPADVTGLTSGVAAVAAGYDHTCALTTGGGLKCWGNNDYGQLGDGAGRIPVDVVGFEPPVGGAVYLRPAASAPSARAPGSPAFPYAALVGAVAAALVLAVGAWYASRRWLR